MLRNYWYYLFSRRQASLDLIGETASDDRLLPLLMFWNIPVFEELFYYILSWLASYLLFCKLYIFSFISVVLLLIGSFIFYLIFRKQAKKSYWQTMLFVSGNETGNPNRSRVFPFRYTAEKYLIAPNKNGAGYDVAVYSPAEKTIQYIIWFLFLVSGIVGKSAQCSELLLHLLGVMIFCFGFRIVVFSLPRKWRKFSITSGQSVAGSPIDN